MTISASSVVAALLVFVRVSALMTALPFFGESSVPVRIRVLVSGAITIFLLPVVQQNWAHGISLAPLPLVAAAVKECVLGLLLGFISRMMIDGVVAAASLLGYQMGFGTASLFVADAQQSMDGFTAFHRLLVLLFFVTLNLHHIFINGLVTSFSILPAGALNFDQGVANELLRSSSLLLLTAVQVAAPVLIALMFAVAALGLISRTVPQLNVFTLSFPVGFFVGLMVYIAALPFFPSMMGDVGELINESFIRIFHL